ALATGGQDGVVRLWEVATGKALTHLHHDQFVRSVAFSPDGKFLLTASWDKTARVWDLATGRPVGQPMLHQDYLTAAAFSPDGQWVLTGCADGTARLWA